ncbi:MAG: hypothetical protein ACP5J4_10600 [Anaerolineae bacterium]
MPDQAVLATWVSTPKECEYARLLIESIRAFGGWLNQCPILLFEGDPQNAPCGELAALESVQLHTLIVPDALKGAILADKVCACAQAETLAGPAVRSLIWFNPDCFVIQPPELFNLASPDEHGMTYDVAIRPVHVKNVGLLASEPVDRFWGKVYATMDVDDVQTIVESYVDGQRIRAYFNTHTFAVNPALGLFRRWLDDFTALVEDRAFQEEACGDIAHQIFLHQAVLSALIVTMLPAERIRLLPPDYSYPYNLQHVIPPERRAQVLNDLVCIANEERPMHPDAVTDITIHEPLRTWLAAHAR